MHKMIPIHQDELQAEGVDVEPIRSIAHEFQHAHRDDHYMFVIQQSGTFLWELDFKEIHLNSAAVSFVAPGQVHRYLQSAESTGWLVFVDANLIASAYREILDLYLNVQQSAVVQSDDISFNIVPILQSLVADVGLPLRNALIRSFTDALAGWITGSIVGAQKSDKGVSPQKRQILSRFKRLLNSNAREVKQVKAYASLLNITPLYLNEVVRNLTGFSASYWINQEIILEAKRLLYYTAMDVKQVAYALGYDDHAYFSRFFKKHTGITALQFRTENHYLSNHSH